jgi:diguanylate cyclase (GGDEF)-like protein
VSLTVGSEAGDEPAIAGLSRSSLHRMMHTLRGPWTPIAKLIAVAAVLGIASLITAVIHWSLLGWHFPVAASLCILALAVVGEIAEMPVALGARRLQVAWGEASLLIGLAFLPLPLMVLLRTTAVLVEQLYHRRDIRRTIFNTLSTPLAVYPAVMVFELVTSAFGVAPGSPASWPMLAAAGFTSAALNCAWVAGAISATSGNSWLSATRTTMSSALFVTFLGTMSITVAVLAAWRYDRTALFILPAFLAVLWQTNARRMQKVTERDALGRLAAASAAIAALSLSEMTEEVRRRASDLFGARDVHLTLLDAPTYGGFRRSDPAVCADGIEVALVGREGDLGSLTLDLDQSGGLNKQEQDVLTTFANTTAAALETVLAHAAQLHAAQHDTLTGLPNRALLADEADRILTAAKAGGGRCALIMLDLDGFKNVNDTLGHAAGDRLLVEIGSRLGQSVRASDCVARLGGDEFVVLLDRLDSDVDAGRLAATLVERVSVPVTIDGLRLAVEASAGVALFPEHGSTIESLLRCADVAMYDAKRRGDSVVHYNSSQDLASPERLGLLADLQSALDADDQLHLHFQPQLDLRTGLPGNVEALVRWRHPTRGPLSPAEFVPVIEHSALIGPFTVKVLNEAVRLCVAWQSDASLHGVGVAVNLSARNLMHRDLPDEVARILARHGLPARKLVLEITETAAMNDTEICESVLGRLRDLGVRLSVDDFGTGYASLTFLRRIDVAEVKLDRAFVADMLEDEAAATIVGATVALAHGLGLTVVAEGVETAEQLRALNLAGCDLAQGYFLSRPVPAELLADGADSAVTKAAQHGVVDPFPQRPSPPRPRYANRGEILSRVRADPGSDIVG